MKHMSCSIVTNVVDDMSDVAVAAKLHEYACSIPAKEDAIRVLIETQTSLKSNKKQRDWNFIFNQWHLSSSSSSSSVDEHKQQQKDCVLIIAVVKHFGLNIIELMLKHNVCLL